MNRKPIGIIHPVKAVSLSWALNEITPGTFALPADSVRWSDVYLRHLHRVEFHHPKLPTWLGVVLEPASAWPDGQVQCSSAEWLYTKRFTDKLFMGSGTETAGELVQMIHEQAIKRQPLGIICGEIDRSGAAYYVEYQLEKAWDAITKICEMTGGAAWVEKIGHSHVDPWLLRYARTVGQDRRGEVLLCGQIVDRPDEKSSAAGMATALHVIGAASGSGTGDLEDRLYLYRVHKPSIDVYGLLEERVEFPDIIDPTLLEEAGGRKLEELSRILRTFGLNIDNRDDVWGRFWLGDIVRAMMTRVGFRGLDTAVRVKGIQYNGDTEKLGLTVEVL